MTEKSLEIAGSRILVVDDTPGNLEVLCLALEAVHYDVMVADSGPVALDLASRFAPDLILLDVTMPGMDGFEVCRRLQHDEGTQPIPVIFLTARGDVDNVVEGLEAGGVDYVIKPIRKQEVLARVRTHLERVRLLRQVVEQNATLQAQTRELQAQTRELEEKNSALEEQMARGERLSRERDELAGQLDHLSHMEAERHGVAGFIGRSPAVRAVLDEVALLRRSRAVSVLIIGESGTGKEGVARAIHFGGARMQGPFVAVNCAAVPGELAESSFFGHVRGAFTGATDNHVGYFEQADGGTFFLDEVGDLPLDLQAKLLRALESAHVTPVGGTTERPVNARIIAATNRDLMQLIQRGLFREDLYFRLAAFTVILPPLRDRREDIPLLVDLFLRQFSEEMGHEPPGVSREALAVLASHRFPGNVRELKNLVEYALIRSQGGPIQAEHLRFIEFDDEAVDNAHDGAATSPPPGAGTAVRPEDRILTYVRDHGSISNTDCRRLLSVDLQRASYLLKKLHAEGVLAKHGERRWTRYSLPDTRV